MGAFRSGGILPPDLARIPRRRANEATADIEEGLRIAKKLSREMKRAKLTQDQTKLVNGKLSATLDVNQEDAY